MADQARDEDQNEDFGPREEGRAKNAKTASAIPAAGALLSLGENSENGQSKDFFWDQAVKLLASGMLALTLLEVLSSISGEAVQCLTPDNYTRDQGAFINAYCTQFTQRTDFFLFLLIAEAILVYGPHFLWYSVFYGKFRYFTALALSLDRHRNSKTGEFDLKNFVTVRALTETFSSTYMIYVTYLVKLFLQLLVAGVFIGVCATLFNEYDPGFDCPANDSLHLINDRWPLDDQIVCVLSSLNLLFAVWWANFVLLAGTVVMSLCGLIWSGLNHHTKLNWRQVAEFTLQSGIQPSYYRPKSWKDRWTMYAFEYRIRSNLDFFVLRLYRDDAGRAKVLREVLIAQLIKEHEQTLQERLSFLHQVGDKGMWVCLLNEEEKKRMREKEPDRCNCKDKRNRAKPNQDLGNTLENVLCNFLTNPIMNLKCIKAVDISFGSSGFKMLIAAMDDCAKGGFAQVVSVNFDPHYLNEEKPFETSRFLSEIESCRTWSTIFSKKREEINKLRDEIAKRFFDIQQFIHGVCLPLERAKAPPEHKRANVVLVGPIPNKESHSIITVHWLLKMLIDHKFIEEECYLVTVRPLRVEDEAVQFAEFVPAWVAASQRGTRADSSEEHIESGSIAQSGSDLEQSSTNSSDASASTNEIPYLRYGTIHDHQQTKEPRVNYYTIASLKPEEHETSRCGNCCGTRPMPTSPRQRGNVLVECGSSWCEFEIKVYRVEASSYASKGQQPQICTPPQATVQIGPQRCSQVQNNLVPNTVNGPPDSVQSCPHLHSEGTPQVHDNPHSQARSSSAQLQLPPSSSEPCANSNHAVGITLV